MGDSQICCASPLPGFQILSRSSDCLSEHPRPKAPAKLSSTAYVLKSTAAGKDDCDLTQEWVEVKPRRWWRRRDPSSPGRHSKHSHQTRSGDGRVTSSFDYKKWLAGRCYRCLAKSHQVAQCREPLRCWCCKRNGHTVRRCPEEHNTTNQPPSPPHIADNATFPPLPEPAKPPIQQRLTWPEPAAGQEELSAWLMSTTAYVPGRPEQRPVMGRANILITEDIWREAQGWRDHAVLVVAPLGSQPTTTLEVVHALS